MSKQTHTENELDALVKQALQDVRKLHQIVNEAGIATATLEEEEIVEKIKQTKAFAEISDEMLVSLAGMFKEIEQRKI